ncbi:hypothetical protein DPEC_G00269790 [Dallia pectoralis]|uniref:Uncharacterized protein n=1 Tax=Dallia pectoralis TaxID=75939 RepID=A0ACC2FPI2_DALPE|nr:hypothetical protein DPEC_G00269790 [Dallia pectoralis]
MDLHGAIQNKEKEQMHMLPSMKETCRAMNRSTRIGKLMLEKAVFEVFELCFHIGRTCSDVGAMELRDH